MYQMTDRKHENDPSLIQKFPMQFMKTMQDNVFGTIGGKPKI